MMIQNKTYKWMLGLLAAGLLSACGGDNAVTSTPELPSVKTSDTSQQEITFNVTGEWNSEATTREATIYENTAALRDEVSHEGAGGNFFHIDAYYDGNTDKYINNSRVFYFTATPAWRFADNSGNIVHYFWPPTQYVVTSLNFLAYAPEILTYTGVTIGTYSDRNPTFNCDLPITNNQTYVGGTVPLKEFIYAFESGKNIENSESGVPLNFLHPFAVVYLRIGSAKQRTTLNSVTFMRIYKKGTGEYNSTGGPTGGPTTDWTPETADNEHDFTISIGKVMGVDMVTGSTFGPFIVMPQSLRGRTDPSLVDIKMVVNYTEYGGSATETSEIALSNTSWDPSKKYIYTLDLGTDDGSVKVGVDVVDWVDQGSNTLINVD